MVLGRKTNVCKEQKREARRVRREDAFSIIALDNVYIEFVNAPTEIY